MKILKILIALSIFSTAVYSADAARSLRKLVGYSIIASDTTDRVYDGKYGEKLINTTGGYLIKVDLMLLDPLPLTDVIIFAKKAPVPNRELESIFILKILIDNEVFDCELIKSPK